LLELGWLLRPSGSGESWFEPKEGNAQHEITHLQP
jgi:hypothetical protein